MPNVMKIFRRKPQRTSTTKFSRLSPTDIALATDQELTNALFNLGSEKVFKIGNAIRTKEQQIERERKALEHKQRPHKEQRLKLEKAVNETIDRIRKLPQEFLTSEGIKEAKTLHNLLLELEKNDSEFQRLGDNRTYSYKAHDVPLNNPLATLHFLSRVRNRAIFRPSKRE